jgi:sodium-dependent dicarboxylate transporter 2/3/5
MSEVAPNGQSSPEEDVSVKDPRLKLAAVILCIVVPLGIYFAPWGIESHTQAALAVTALMLLAWMTHVVEYAVAGLAGCLLYWMLGVVEPEIAFSGFALEITWFVFAALMLGVIATKSGLPQRVGSFIVTRVGMSYSAILLGLIITDFVLTFIVPTGVGRVVIMATIAIGLINLFDAKPGSNVARGMFLIITYTATIFDKMIIAGAASITARGAIIEYGGVEVGWGMWFVAFLPADILTILAAWRITLWLYPPEIKSIEGKQHLLKKQFEIEEGWTPQSKRAAVIIGGTIAIWVTDVFHGIDPAMVAFAAAMVALLPYVGVINTDDIRKANLMPFLFVGAALSMSNVLRESGGLELIAGTVLTGLEPLIANSMTALPILYWGAFVYHLFLASEISMLATSLPILMEFARANALDPLWIGLVWSFAAGGKIFVYQTAVLVVGYSYGYFRHVDLIKMGIAITLVEFINVILVAMLWWPIIGIG